MMLQEENLPHKLMWKATVNMQECEITFRLSLDNVYEH